MSYRQTFFEGDVTTRGVEVHRQGILPVRANIEGEDCGISRLLKAKQDVVSIVGCDATRQVRGRSCLQLAARFDSRVFWGMSGWFDVSNTSFDLSRLWREQRFKAEY